MKPIYKSVAMASVMLAISLQLSAELNNAGDITSQKVQAESLQGLKVKLVSPNVSGAKDLIASGDCVLANEYINVNLSGLAQGTHRLTVSAEYGTQTVVLYALDIVVPAKLAEGEQEFTDKIVVVSTYADGDNSGADASVYAKDGDGNAHITKPLSVGDGVASGDGGAVASGYADGDEAQIVANGNGAVVSGYAGGDGSRIFSGSDGTVASGCAESDGSLISADGSGAVAVGHTAGENSKINASANGAVAGGHAHGDESQIIASGEGAVAFGNAYGGESLINADGSGAVACGYARGEGSHITADGSGAIAAGYIDDTSGDVEAAGNGSQAFGIGTKAQNDGQMVLGKCNVVDENGDYALIVGNGTADDARSNAFAIDWNGNLVLFNAGTPVVLTPAKLAQLIA